MRLALSGLASLLLLAGEARGQVWQSDWYPKHNFTVGAGAARPRADLAPLLEDSAVFDFAYGYRFHKYLQADIGLDTVYGAARINDYLQTTLGDLRIRDFQFLMPFGGRVILPAGTGRLLFSGGAGGAYLRYQERLKQPYGGEYYQVDCPVCTARQGLAGYALVNLKGAVDRGQHFWVGATAKRYWGRTDGDPLGNIPAIRTKDQWLVFTAEFSVAF
jgi:hypothetical protein